MKLFIRSDVGGKILSGEGVLNILGGLLSCNLFFSPFLFCFQFALPFIVVSKKRKLPPYTKQAKKSLINDRDRS